MYTVEWTQVALRRLTKLLTDLSSADWKYVTGAIDLLDERLRSAPLRLGESRDGMRRIAFIGRLTVLFEVDEDDQRVTVLTVSWLGASRT